MEQKQWISFFYLISHQINLSFNLQSVKFSHGPETTISPWIGLGNDIIWNDAMMYIPSFGNYSIGNDINIATQANITINGKDFESGLVTFVPTLMAFLLDKKYRMLKTCIAAAKNTEDGAPACDNEKQDIKFQILGDNIPLKMNEKIWFTKSSKEDATCLEIEISNVSVLELRSQYQTNLQPCGLAVWTDTDVFPKGMIYHDKYYN